MKNLTGALLAIVVGVSGVQAADLPGSVKDNGTYVYSAPVNSGSTGFAGAYIGASVNFDMLDVQHRGDITFPQYDGETESLQDVSIFGGPQALPDISDDEFSGGVRIGRNWQIGQVYFGPIAMFDLGGPSAGLSYADDEGFTASGEMSVNWKATLAAKLGFAVTERIGLYGLVGWTLADVDVDARAHQSFDQDGNGIGIDKHHNDTLSGFTYGGGVDLKVTGNWSAFAEYQHIDLSDFDAKGSLGFDALKYSYKGEPDLDTIKVGATYTFN